MVGAATLLMVTPETSHTGSIGVLRREFFRVRAARVYRHAPQANLRSVLFEHRRVTPYDGFAIWRRMSRARFSDVRSSVAICAGARQSFDILVSAIDVWKLQAVRRLL